MTEHDLDVMRYCVKAYLQHIKFIQDDIRELELRILADRSKVDVMGIAYDRISVKTSSEGDTIGAAIARIEEHCAEMAQRITLYGDLYNQARDYCQPHYIGRYACWLHEVEGRSWEYVGRIIGYEERQMRRIADGGIREIYDWMPEEYRRYTIPPAI